jgi:hypothetical protein
LLRSRNMIVAHDGSNWTLEPAEPPTLASHQATEVTMG